MRKFRVEVTRTDEYLIEIDETIYGNPEWKDQFERDFWKLDEGLESVAESLAWHRMRNGDELRFIEGFGPVKVDGKLPFSLEDYENGKLKPEEKREAPAPGLNIIIISENDDYSFEIEEEQP